MRTCTPQQRKILVRWVCETALIDPILACSPRFLCRDLDGIISDGWASSILFFSSFFSFPFFPLFLFLFLLFSFLSLLSAHLDSSQPKITLAYTHQRERGRDGGLLKTLSIYLEIYFLSRERTFSFFSSPERAPRLCFYRYAFFPEREDFLPFLSISFCRADSTTYLYNTSDTSLRPLVWTICV